MQLRIDQARRTGWGQGYFWPLQERGCRRELVLGDQDSRERLASCKVFAVGIDNRLQDGRPDLLDRQVLAEHLFPQDRESGASGRCTRCLRPRPA